MGGETFDGNGALLRLLFCCSLSVENANTEARVQRPNFRAHFNLWWARHGWPLIHLVSRPDGQFSRPPYFTAGVNLTAESAIEPPRGGEHGAGETCLNKKRSFAESRNCSDYRLREQHTWVKENAADSKSESAAKESQSSFLYIILLKRLN